MSGPRVKLSSIDFAPLDRPRHRRARRKGFAEDRQLLLKRPDAPTGDAFNDLNAGGTTTHTTSRKTTRIDLNLAIHPALRQNTQTAKLSLQTQGGAQTTLTDYDTNQYKAIIFKIKYLMAIAERPGLVDGVGPRNGLT